MSLPDSAPGNDGPKKQSQLGPEGHSIPASNLRLVFPETLHLHISVEGVPGSISTVSPTPSKPQPESEVRGFFKDYLPVLKPIAAALVSFVLGFYGSKINDQLTRDTLDKITAEFVDGKGNTAIAAMKLATYGDKVLPAVLIALGSKDTRLRDGAVQIAKQIYLEQTMKREKLTAVMLKSYDNPFQQIGVLEWFASMESEKQLTEEDGDAALLRVKGSFGSNGEQCSAQGQDLAVAAANFLAAGAITGTKDFARGMEKNCPNFTGVQNTLHDITGDAQ